MEGEGVLRWTTIVACSGARECPIVYRESRAASFISSFLGTLRFTRGAQIDPGCAGGKISMKTVVPCAQCDKPERDCKCDRYCCYCQGLEGIRLCADGKFYCPYCREACEIHVAESDEG